MGVIWDGDSLTYDPWGDKPLVEGRTGHFGLSEYIPPAQRRGSWTLKVELLGDTDRAHGLMLAQLPKLLGIFRNSNKFQALKQNAWMVGLYDGKNQIGYIRMKTVFGTESAEVYAAPMGTTTEEKAQRDMEVSFPAFFITSPPFGTLHTRVFLEDGDLNPDWPEDSAPPDLGDRFHRINSSGFSYGGYVPAPDHVLKSPLFTDGKVLEAQFDLEMRLDFSAGLGGVSVSVIDLYTASYRGIGLTFDITPNGVTFRHTGRVQFQAPYGVRGVNFVLPLSFGSHTLKLTGGAGEYSILIDGAVVTGEESQYHLDADTSALIYQYPEMTSSQHSLEVAFSDLSYDLSQANDGAAVPEVTVSPVGFKFTPAPRGWIHFDNYPKPPVRVPV